MPPVDPFELGLKGFRFVRRHEFGKKFLRKVMPRFASKREAKWDARKAKRRQAAEAVNGDYFNDDSNEDTPMLQGFKSFAGLATMAIGFVLSIMGIGECPIEAADCVTSEAITGQIMNALDKIVLAAGGVVATWGVIDKARREAKLRKELAAAKK